jgi:hypothetical protein
VATTPPIKLRSPYHPLDVGYGVFIVRMGQKYYGFQQPNGPLQHMGLRAPGQAPVQASVTVLTFSTDRLQALKGV